jgi:hypothetical protein
MKTYCHSFCGKPHRIDDGRPVEHACFVLPAEAVAAEAKGDRSRSDFLLEKWNKRRPHNGLKACPPKSANP